MKYAVIYSSKTGNTKKVAEAIHRVMPEGTGIYPVEEAPEAGQVEIPILGFWVDRGLPDEKMKSYIKKLKDKKRVGLFATLGAYPDSKHAVETMERSKGLFEKNCRIFATFICQGRIDPVLTEKFKKLPADHPHAMTPERIARHEAAKKHPDEIDLANAQEVFQKAVKYICEEGEDSNDCEYSS